MTTPSEWLTGGVGGGGIIAAVLTYLGGKHHGRAEFINATTKAAEMVIERLQAECERVTGRCTELEKQMARERQECDAKLAEFRVRLDRYMQGPVPPYTVGPAE